VTSPPQSHVSECESVWANLSEKGCARRFTNAIKGSKKASKDARDSYCKRPFYNSFAVGSHSLKELNIRYAEEGKREKKEGNRLRVQL